VKLPQSGAEILFPKPSKGQSVICGLLKNKHILNDFTFGIDIEHQRLPKLPRIIQYRNKLSD
jgi:hypothetical protein